jgi:hypothetical protein
MSACRSFKISLLAAIGLLAGSLCASAEEPRFVWGINGHPLVSYPGISIEEQLDAVRDLGMSSYRVDVQGEHKMDALAELVREGKKRGIEILPVVTPIFDLDKETPEALRKKSYDLAFALVSRFKGDIKVWELGNELDNYAILKRCERSEDGKGGGCLYDAREHGRSPNDYSKVRWAKSSAVLKGLTEGAHAADPSVRRAIGTAGWAHIGAFELMKSDGISWDISIWHMYGEDPEWAFKILAGYGHPIWVTEFNNPYGSQRGKDQQAKGIVSMMTRLKALQSTYNVEAAHIYELLDESYWGDDYEAHMGLIEMKEKAKGQWVAAGRKPAYGAVKDFIERVGDRPQHELAIQRHCEMKNVASGSTLPADDVITYAYCLMLGREPDGFGLDSWSAQLADGMPIESVLVGMMQSDEFAQHYDISMLSKREHVTLLHRLLLDADPGESVLKQEVKDLADKQSPIDLMQVIVGSKAFRAKHPTLFAKLGSEQAAIVPPVDGGPKPEVRRNCDPSVMSRPLEYARGQIIYSYCLVLGRWPDAYGLRTWIADMHSGLTLEHFLERLLESDEFTAKYQLDAMSNTNFVTLVYRLLLGRDPDHAGLQSYVSQLSSGAIGRSQVYEAILNSDEFRAKQAALFTALKAERRRAELGTH